MECDRFRVRARSGIDFETDGDIQQTVKGNHSLAVEGSSRLEARDVAVKATDGDVDVAATADTRVAGARVLINC